MGARRLPLEHATVGQPRGEHVRLVHGLAHLLDEEEVGELIEPVEDELKDLDDFGGLHAALLARELVEADDLRE